MTTSKSRQNFHHQIIQIYKASPRLKSCTKFHTSLALNVTIMFLTKCAINFPDLNGQNLNQQGSVNQTMHCRVQTSKLGRREHAIQSAIMLVDHLGSLGANNIPRCNFVLIRVSYALASSSHFVLTKLHVR